MVKPYQRMPAEAVKTTRRRHYRTQSTSWPSLRMARQCAANSMDGQRIGLQLTRTWYGSRLDQPILATMPDTHVALAR